MSRILEIPESAEASPRPKDLITVDTSAITPVKNLDPEVDLKMSPAARPRKRKLSSKSVPATIPKSAVPVQMSLLKTQPGSARTDPEKNIRVLRRVTEKKVNVVIVPEGFVDFQD